MNKKRLHKAKWKMKKYIKNQLLRSKFCKLYRNLISYLRGGIVIK